MYCLSLPENWSTGPWRSLMSQSFSWRSTSTKRWGLLAAAARRPRPMCVYVCVCVWERQREQVQSARVVICLSLCVWELSWNSGQIALSPNPPFLCNCECNITPIYRHSHKYKAVFVSWLHGLFNPFYHNCVVHGFKCHLNFLLWKLCSL